MLAIITPHHLKEAQQVTVVYRHDTGLCCTFSGYATAIFMTYRRWKLVLYPTRGLPTSQGRTPLTGGHRSKDVSLRDFCFWPEVKNHDYTEKRCIAVPTPAPWVRISHPTPLSCVSLHSLTAGLRCAGYSTVYMEKENVAEATSSSVYS